MENIITEATEVSPIETALAKENITNQVIERLRTNYLGLKINGLDDKEGFNKVETARKECKSIRNLATNICKKEREAANAYSKAVIAKEKEVVGQISEVEDYLEAQSNEIKELEKAILFKEAQRLKLPLRKEKLASIGVEVPEEKLLECNDDDFNALFNEFYEKHLAEKAEALRAAEAKLEAERLQAERLEIEKKAEAKRLQDIEDAKEAARIKAEKDAADAIARAEKEKAEAEERERKAKEKAIEDARIAAEKAEAEKAEALRKAEEDKQKEIAKLKKEQEEKEEAERKAKAEAERKAEEEKQLAIEAELSKGDSAKMNDLQADLEALKVKYTFKSKKHKAIYSDVNTLLDKIVNHIIAKS